jgi:hypothetical protein
MPTKTRSKTKTKEEPEYFSLVEYTAGLDAFTMEARIDAERSLYRFAQVVIGYDALPPDCPYRLYEPIHKPMCDRAEAVLPIKGRESRSTQRKLLDLEPRGSLKTHLLTATTLLYYLTQNYDGRELISSHNQEASKEILGIIKWNIEFNAKFKQFYGDWAYFAKKYGIWRDDYIQLAFRTAGLREPTISTCGAEKSKTGGHYDVIAVDDIQNRENVRSQSERQNVRERLQEYFPQLEPNGAMIVPATRYHRQDVYGWIMKRVEAARKRLKAKNLPAEQRAEEESWLFEIVVKSAWNADGTLYYPTRLTSSFLQQQEDELEDYLFSVWYRNEPLDEHAKVFINPQSKERNFDFVRGALPYLEFPNGARTSVYMTASWDPKGRENPNRPNDAHGFLINGTDSIGGWWTMEALELRLPLDDLLDRICVLLKHYCVMKLSIETRGSGTQGLYIDLLRPVMKRHGIEDVQIVEWSPGTTESKDTLIRSLQPQLRRGLWHFQAGRCDPLIRQLDDFPMVEHDDVLDAAVQQLKIARPAEPQDFAPGFGEDSAEDHFDEPEGEEGILGKMGDGTWVGLGTPAMLGG